MSIPRHQMKNILPHLHRLQTRQNPSIPSKTIMFVKCLHNGPSPQRQPAIPPNHPTCARISMKKYTTTQRPQQNPTKNSNQITFHEKPLNHLPPTINSTTESIVNIIIIQKLIQINFPRPSRFTPRVSTV